MIHINFLLFPRVHLMDLAGPAQVFYEANGFSAGQYNLRYIASSTAVRSQQGISFCDLQLFNEVKINKDSIVCVPGVDFSAFEKGELDHDIEQIKDWLLTLHNKGVVIMSICSGTLILAKAGVLTNKACTSHWKCFTYLKHHYPGITLKENSLYCRDGNVYTSAGMTAGIDMTLAIIEKYGNPLIAAKVAQEMVINIRREEVHDQKNLFLDFKNKYHPVVYQVQNIIDNRMDEIVSMNQLAVDVNMSERNLNRIFKKFMNQSITNYRNQVKISKAEHLLKFSTMSIKEIANTLGYSTPQYFLRVWKKKHPVSPGRFRKKLISASSESPARDSEGFNEHKQQVNLNNQPQSPQRI